MSQESGAHAEYQNDAPLSGALDFLKVSPIYISVQAYRDTAFDDQETETLRNHVDSWRTLLAKHGVIYDGLMLNGDSPSYPDLIYYVAMPIDTVKYPSALSLVLDAVYEASNELPTADWEVYAVEQVVTPMVPSGRVRGLLPSQKVFVQRTKGLPQMGGNPAVSHFP